jgi:aryl-alcohol dehydrogenase-like predicted oxidoreductase
MLTRRLGSNGPQISVIGFGAWEAGGTHWGPNDSDEQVMEAIRAGLDAGITWIDTAEVYGEGVSETLVGRAVAGRRDDIVLATKVAPGPEGTGFRPEEVHKACEGSLGRLGTDRVDLYQLHWPDESGVPLEDTWGAMAELQDAGMVRWIGVSNFERPAIELCEAIRHVDSLQPEFSVLSRSNAELIRWCGEHGTGVVAYGPLAFGVLTGRMSRESFRSFDDWRAEESEGVFGPDAIERNLAVVEAMRPVADRLRITLAQLALAWNVHQPGVTSAIAGSRNPDHVRENAAAGDIVLDRAAVAVLDALTPAP